MRNSDKSCRGNANARSLVIASQRVRAKRGPMTGSAKQSRIKRETLDCFVASLLAMTSELIEGLNVNLAYAAFLTLSGSACSIARM